MNLSVLVLGSSPDWQLLLQQSGISHYYLKDENDIKVQRVPCVIINKSVGPKEKEAVISYTEQGGCLLLEAEKAAKLFGNKIKKTRIIYLNNQRQDTFINPFLKCDVVPQKYAVTIKSNFLVNQKNEWCFTEADYGLGKLIIIPGGFLQNVTVNKAIRKNFPALPGTSYPSERVSLVSKNILRVLMEDILKYCFHFRGLPFLQQSPVPNGNTSCFIFRIDSDMASKNDFRELYKLCTDYDIPASWFIETKTSMDKMELIADMQHQEIAYHCYRHKIFRSYREQRNDFNKGMAILKNAQITPKGYAAPFGDWNPVISDLLKEFNFLYSSEFSLDYDNLPFYPFVKGGFSSVLQIPVHPVSTGILSWARFTEDEMIRYYKWIITQKISLGQPIVLYHHPGSFLNVFKEIFRYVKQQEIDTLNMESYALWWKNKISFKWQAKYKDKLLNFESAGNDPGISYRLFYPDGKSTSFTNINNKWIENRLTVNYENQANDINVTAFSKKSWRFYHKNILWHYRKWKQ